MNQLTTQTYILNKSAVYTILDKYLDAAQTHITEEMLKDKTRKQVLAEIELSSRAKALNELYDHVKSGKCTFAALLRILTERTSDSLSKEVEENRDKIRGLTYTLRVLDNNKNPSVLTKEQEEEIRKNTEHYDNCVREEREIARLISSVFTPRVTNILMPILMLGLVGTNNSKKNSIFVPDIELELCVTVSIHTIDDAVREFYIRDTAAEVDFSFKVRGFNTKTTFYK